MLLGPIFQVDMVSTARRKRYFGLRIAYAALILLVLWGAYESSGLYGAATRSIQQGTMLATSFFVSFSWLQMLTILVVGPALVIGTIAVERERRTIEYLFATDLSNHEIILGKTVSRLLLLGQLVLVGLPILFLFRLLGGIPTNLLLTTFLLAGSTAVMITALSLCVSVWSARARDATVRVYLLLAALLFLPVVLEVFGRMTSTRLTLWPVLVQPMIDLILVINPMWSLGQAMGNVSAMGLGLDMSVVLWSVGWQLVVSTVALAWATAAVRRVHLGSATRGEVKPKRSWNYRFPRWKLSLGERPMIWKEMFAGTSQTRLGMVGSVALTLIMMTVLGMTLFQFLLCISDFGGSRSKPSEQFLGYLTGLTGFLGCGMLLLLAARAAGLVTSEKEHDCWLSLLATPLSGREIMTGKMWGNLYGLRWPMLVLASAWTLGVVIEPGFIFAIVAMAFTFLVTAWYATNLGLWYSLRSQTTLRSMGATLGTIVFTAGGYLFCCCVVFASGPGAEEQLFIFLAPCIPFLLGFPGVAYIAISNGNFLASEESLVVAFGLGIVLYIIVGFVLYALMTGDFNRLANRTGIAPDDE